MGKQQSDEPRADQSNMMDRISTTEYNRSEVTSYKCQERYVNTLLCNIITSI